MTYEERQKQVCDECNKQRPTDCPYRNRDLQRKCPNLDSVMYGWELGQKDTIEEIEKAIKTLKES